jgi:hypothetical protein
MTTGGPWPARCGIPRTRRSVSFLLRRLRPRALDLSKTGLLLAAPTIAGLLVALVHSCLFRDPAVHHSLLEALEGRVDALSGLQNHLYQACSHPFLQRNVRNGLRPYYGTRPRLLERELRKAGTGKGQPSGTLSMGDAVTSLGGMSVEVDGVGIDACCSASQKFLGCPPGLAPLTVSERAMAVVAQRPAARSWYYDWRLLAI